MVEPVVDLAAAVRDANGGTSIDVEVVPGARSSEFPAGWNAWRKRVEARVAAPPEKGEANAELARIAAECFGVPARDVEVTSGHTSRRKTLLVRNLTAVAARERLARDLA